VCGLLTNRLLKYLNAVIERSEAMRQSDENKALWYVFQQSARYSFSELRARQDLSWSEGNGVSHGSPRLTIFRLTIIL